MYKITVSDNYDDRAGVGQFLIFLLDFAVDKWRAGYECGIHDDSRLPIF